jgi:LysM repeat protein
VATDVQDQPLEQVLMGFGESSETSVFVYWSDLNQRGIDRDAELPEMPLAGQTVERALRMLSNVLDLDGANRLDHRVESGLMEIATREFFALRELDLDHRQRELVSYDAAGLLVAETPLARSEASATLIELVTTLIEPDMWECNGGIATISAAGNRLFVNAPRRVHDRVAWLLTELMQNSGALGAGERTGPTDDAAANPGLSPAPTSPAGEGEHAFRISAPEGAVRVEIPSSTGRTQILEASQIEISGRGEIWVTGAARLSQIKLSVPAYPTDGPAACRALPVEYVVRPGDTLESIAARVLGDAGLAPSLLALNPGLDQATLAVGRALALPHAPSGAR